MFIGGNVVKTVAEIGDNREMLKSIKLKVRALFWNSPIMVIFLLLNIFISFFIYEFSITKGWNFIFFIIPIVFLFIFQIIIFFRRGKRLESEILTNLPEGWHLIFRFVGGAKGGMYVPELISEDEFRNVLAEFSNGNIFSSKKIKFTGKDIF